MGGFTFWLDGGIVAVYLLGTMVAGLMVRRYVTASRTSSWPAAR